MVLNSSEYSDFSLHLRFHLEDKTRLMLLQIARESVSDYVASTEQSWAHVTDDFRIANLRREPTVTLVEVDGGYIEFTVSYVVDYLKRTVTKDQLFTRILDAVSTNESKVRWASSSGAATPPRAPAPASQEVLARASLIAGSIAH